MQWKPLRARTARAAPPTAGERLVGYLVPAALGAVLLGGALVLLAPFEAISHSFGLGAAAGALLGGCVAYWSERGEHFSDGELEHRQEDVSSWWWVWRWWT